MTTITKTSHFFLRGFDRGHHIGVVPGTHRIGVVALRYTSETDKAASVTVAVSLCHYNDPWNSATGVAAALGRLDSRKHNEQGGNVSYRVDDVLHLADVFYVLTPSGFLKRRNHVDWPKMQALFERQWKYLTTSPDPTAVKREKPAKVPTQAGYYWARRKPVDSRAWTVVRLAEYADGLRVYDEHDIALDRWEWGARLPAPDEAT